MAGEEKRRKLCKSPEGFTDEHGKIKKKKIRYTAIPVEHRGIGGEKDHSERMRPRHIADSIQRKREVRGKKNKLALVLASGCIVFQWKEKRKKKRKKGKKRRPYSVLHRK